MNKESVVKNNRDFSNIIKNGKYVKNEYLVIYALPNNIDRYRFGISVGKKIGNAVVRNKIKRQLRNIVYKYKKSYLNCNDYIIIVRNSYTSLNFSEIDDCFKNLIDKLNGRLLNERKKEK